MLVHSAKKKKKKEEEGDQDTLMLLFFLSPPSFHSPSLRTVSSTPPYFSLSTASIDPSAPSLSSPEPPLLSSLSSAYIAWTAHSISSPILSRLTASHSKLDLISPQRIYLDSQNMTSLHIHVSPIPYSETFSVSVPAKTWRMAQVCILHSSSILYLLLLITTIIIVIHLILLLPSIVPFFLSNPHCNRKQKRRC